MITKYKEIARAYQEMGELNLEISQEFYWSETTAMELGDALNEMDTDETKKEAQ